MISPAHFANSRPQQHLTTAGSTPCPASNPGTAISNPYSKDTDLDSATPMQQAFLEHLLGVQPGDQHLEEDMNEPHPDL